MSAATGTDGSLSVWACFSMTLDSETIGGNGAHVKEVHSLSSWQNKRLIKGGDLYAVGVGSSMKKKKGKLSEKSQRVEGS